MAISACSSDSPTGEAVKPPVKIEFWHSMGDRSHQELLQEFAREYNQSHPRVAVEPVFQGLYGNLYQKLIAAITSGHPPALCQMYESWTTRLYVRGRLDPIQNYVSGPNGYSPEQLSDFYPAFLEDNRWDGLLVTLPFNKSVYMLQYNEDLLRSAGFESPPEDWDQLRRMANAVSQLKDDSGQACWGLLVRQQLESFTTLYFSAWGDFLDSQSRPQMESPLARRTLGYLCGLIHQDKSALVDATYPASLLGTGRLGMFIHSSASFPFNDRFAQGKFHWRAAPVPSPTGNDPGARKTLFQGMNIGILAGQPAEVRAAAWDFLKFLLDPARGAAWAVQTGYCPIRRSTLDIPDFRAYLQSRPNYALAVREIERAKFEPKPDFWESWRTDVGDEIITALQGIKTPDEALDAAQRDGLDSLRYDSKVSVRSIP
ncbi:ABC transporter substrate-binding protein [Candidatus Sumerlaeota bacterium]|nr:ABC transporter substrate-binding protein [Candidatus Sumerlaeota bacterium]